MRLAEDVNPHRRPAPVGRVGRARRVQVRPSLTFFDLLDRHGCSVADVVAGVRRALTLKTC